MYRSIGEVAEVIPGYHFRERLASSSAGNVAVVQMRDVGDGDLEPSHRFVRVDLDPDRERSSIKDGDVILRSRGDSFYAVLARGSFDRTVVAAPLTIIRANPRVILADFLKWLVNQPGIQASLQGLAAGTHVRTVNKDALKGLPIPLPSLERQRTIVEFAALAVAEQDLLARVAARRRRLAERILWHYAQDAR